MLEDKELVVQEKADLVDKIDTLVDFINSEGFSEIHDNEQDRLRRQLVAMTEYADILEERISNF
jgi:hypothetical protein